MERASHGDEMAGHHESKAAMTSFPAHASGFEFCLPESGEKLSTATRQRMRKLAAEARRPSVRQARSFEI